MIMAVRMVAVDLMVVAGIDPERAGNAYRVGTGKRKVHTPPPTPHTVQRGPPRPVDDQVSA
jgi:hypothetical protein